MSTGTILYCLHLVKEAKPSGNLRASGYKLRTTNQPSHDYSVHSKRLVFKALITGPRTRSHGETISAHVGLAPRPPRWGYYRGAILSATAAPLGRDVSGRIGPQGWVFGCKAFVLEIAGWLRLLHNEPAEKMYIIRCYCNLTFLQPCLFPLRLAVTLQAASLSSVYSRRCQPGPCRSTTSTYPHAVG